MRSCSLFSRSDILGLQDKAGSLKKTGKVQAAKQRNHCWVRGSLAERNEPRLPVPLSERPATQQGSVQQLLAWRLQQLKHIEAAGDELEALDNGPSASQLKVLSLQDSLSFCAAKQRQYWLTFYHAMCKQTELEWLLEDSVGGRQGLKALFADGEQLVRANGGAARTTPLRLSLPQLDGLWTRRFTGRHDGPLPSASCKVLHLSCIACSL